MLALSSLDLCKSISKTLSGVIKEEEPLLRSATKAAFYFDSFYVSSQDLSSQDFSSLYFKQWKIVFAFGINGPLETSNPSQSIKGQ